MLFIGGTAGKMRDRSSFYLQFLQKFSFWAKVHKKYTFSISILIHTYTCTHIYIHIYIYVNIYVYVYMYLTIYKYRNTILFLKKNKSWKATAISVFSQGRAIFDPIPVSRYLGAWFLKMSVIAQCKGGFSLKCHF